MHRQFRKVFNDSYSKGHYQSLLDTIERDFPGQLDFRVAESPVFLDTVLTEKLLAACDGIIKVVSSPGFREATEKAIPFDENVPNENDHTSFLAIDFAVCRGASGELEPQLIELQGFPSVFGYQLYLSELFRKQYALPESSRYVFTQAKDEAAAFRELFGKLLLGDKDPENVILLEIFPEEQKTRIDFAATALYWGVTTVCLTKIIKEGRNLFYEKKGRKIPIYRIYNRLIFDDLYQHAGLVSDFHPTDDVEVEWVGHPNWFFRISKFMLPMLSGPYYPETSFLDTYQGNFPHDLENYVLKPLFSFAGSGVDLHLNREKLAAIKNPGHFILQRKVTYEPVVLTDDGSLVKAEIRMLFIWPDRSGEPVLLTALSRLSRGEMIGVRFNKDVTWVGGSAVFFETQKEA